MKDIWKAYLKRSCGKISISCVYQNAGCITCYEVSFQIKSKLNYLSILKLFFATENKVSEDDLFNLE